LIVFDEEALDDPLVHDNERDLWCLCLVVELLNGRLELRDLLGEAKITLSIAKTISVDEEVGWVLPLVLRGKVFDSKLDSTLHRSLDDFLALLLDDVLRVVLTHLGIGRCCETNHRVRSRVADINTNKHGAH